MLREHPDRPQRPARLVPMKGDDNSAWRAWWNACDTCEHSHPKWGCVSMGVVVYENGAKYGFHRVRGGCRRWSPRDPHLPLTESADG